MIDVSAINLLHPFFFLSFFFPRCLKPQTLPRPPGWSLIYFRKISLKNLHKIRCFLKYLRNEPESKGENFCFDEIVCRPFSSDISPRLPKKWTRRVPGTGISGIPLSRRNDPAQHRREKKGVKINCCWLLPLEARKPLRADFQNYPGWLSY